MVTSYFVWTINIAKGISSFYVLTIGLSFLISDRGKYGLTMYALGLSLLTFFAATYGSAFYPSQVSEELIEVLNYTLYPIAFISFYILVLFFRKSLDQTIESLNASNQEKDGILKDLSASEEELLTQQEELSSLNQQLDERNLQLLQEYDIAEVTQEMGKIGYWEVSFPNQKTHFSRVVSEIYGLLAGSVPSFEEGLEYYPTEAKDQITKANKNAIENHEGYDLVLPFLKEKKEQIWIRTMCRVIVEDGEVIKLFGTFQDVTDQKQKEELLRINEMLEKAVAFKSEFLAQMSHEIRTPLNGMVGLLDILATSNHLDDQERDYLNTIRNSSDDLMKIISNVLTLSKLEAGKEELYLSEFSIENLIKELIMLYEGRAKSRNIQLKFEAESLLALIRLDEVKVKQVLRNFLSNALKFSFDGGAITIRVKYEAGCLNVDVEDEGRGIRQSEQKLLFTKFSQTSSSVINKFEGSNMGTGLGLQISKHLVELMQGEIVVDSEPNKGSTFWFSVPAEEVLRKEVDDIDASEQNEKTKFDIKVLVVEDKVLNQKVVDVMLKSLGCQVDIAENGEKAIEAVMADENQYDLILMDIQMPVMDGITATHEIRRLLGNDCPRIVALSAKGMEVEQAYVTKNGWDEYLSKPIKLDVLKALLHRYF